MDAPLGQRSTAYDLNGGGKADVTGLACVSHSRNAVSHVQVRDTAAVPLLFG